MYVYIPIMSVDYVEKSKTGQMSNQNQHWQCQEPHLTPLMSEQYFNDL